MQVGGWIWGGRGKGGYLSAPMLPLARARDASFLQVHAEPLAVAPHTRHARGMGMHGVYTVCRT